MSKVLKALHIEHEDDKKLLQETPEASHVDTLMQRRIESLEIFVREHFPDNPQRKQILHHAHEIRGLTHKALESKA